MKRVLKGLVMLALVLWMLFITAAVAQEVFAYEDRSTDCECFDMNGDGRVNLMDVSHLRARIGKQYGRKCG